MVLWKRGDLQFLGRLPQAGYPCAPGTPSGQPRQGVGEARWAADGRVLVEQVHVVEAGPGGRAADRLERRHPVRERGPDLFLELGVVDLQRRVRRRGRIARWRAREEARSLGAKP